MRYREAKRLRRGDEVIMKRKHMEVSLRVTAVRWDDKTVTVEACDEFNSSLELTHLQIK